MFERAIAAGAQAKRPLTDEFYGDRTGQLEDPFGHIWSIQTRMEDIRPKAMQKRLDAMAVAAPTSRRQNQRQSRRRSSDPRMWEECGERHICALFQTGNEEPTRPSSQRPSRAS